MQIHELTYPKIDEGILNGIKSVAAKAAGAVGNAASAAGNAIASSTSWDAYNANKAAKTTAAQTGEYVNRLAQQWQQAAKSIPRTFEPEDPAKAAKKAELDALKKEVEREKYKDNLRKTIDQYGAQSGQLAQALIKKGAVQAPGQQVPALLRQPAKAPVTAPTTISAPPPKGAPTPAELAKLQQKIDAAAKAQVSEAFSDLPGAKPVAGNPVSAKVTAPPRGIKGRSGEWSPTYAKFFQHWVDQKMASVIPGTKQPVNMPMVRKMPEFSSQLNQALSDVVKSRKDPAKNDEAVKKYLTIAVKGMQAKSAQLKQTHPELQQRIKAHGQAVKSTGNADADHLLIQQGYKVSDV